MDNTFPKKIRITKRNHYKWMCYGYDRRVGQYIVVDCKKNSLNFSRLGVTVTKKFGHSHVRNYFKRVVREAFRQCRGKLLSGFDFNVRPRSSGRYANTNDVIQELLSLVGSNGSKSTPSRGPRSQS
ncbi:MAG: ribonuclease P protein component [Chlamydiota bacterium]|nr:ribonuclease P protein component [Chlamydiota bacterium]